MLCCDSWKFPIRQGFVALGPILVTISLGMCEGYSAILLPQLESMSLDEELLSWIASMAALPMAIGCIIGGYAMEKIGRKTIHMVTCLPCIIGWLTIAFAANTTAILIGRFLTGLSVGLLGPPTGVYMSETSSPTMRGFLLASISFAIALGLFLAHLIGTFLHWQTTALICCLFPILCLILMGFAPESPTYLAKIGKIPEAKKAFLWCRGNSPQSQLELDVLIQRQADLNENNWRDEFRNLKRVEFVKPLIIIVIFFVTCQWSGLNALTFYSIAIIQQTLHGEFDEYLAMLIMDAIRVAMSLLACILLKTIGRRPLAITSGLGTAFSLLTLSIYTYSHTTNYTFIPMTALLTYVTFITIGFVPLPWTMMGEVFPLASRGMGSGISALSAYIAFFSVVKTTPAMFSQIGAEGAFLTYGLIALIGTGILMKFLPETKDRALFQIEDHFKA